MIKAVIDTGIFIHLEEIELVKVLELFKIFVPSSVKSELNKYLVFDNLSSKLDIAVTKLSSEDQKESETVARKYAIENTDAEALILSNRLKIMLLTDDWDLRETANIFGIESHGTIGILFKEYNEKILKKSTIEKALKDLLHKSSLHISSEIINEALSILKKH